MNATKHDGGKVRLELLPPDALTAAAEVFTYGARKYAAWNWTNGFDWSRLYGATLRHLNAWNAGEDLDSESGKPHLSHALCELMMLAAHQLRGLGKDDRHRLAAHKSSGEIIAEMGVAVRELVDLIGPPPNAERRNAVPLRDVAANVKYVQHATCACRRVDGNPCGSTLDDQGRCRNPHLHLHLHREAVKYVTHGNVLTEVREAPAEAIRCASDDGYRLCLKSNHPHLWHIDGSAHMPRDVSGWTAVKVMPCLSHSTACKAAQ